MLDTECMGTYFMGRSRKWKEKNEAVSRERTERKGASAEDICEIQGNCSIANADETDPAEMENVSQYKRRILEHCPWIGETVSKHRRRCHPCTGIDYSPQQKGRRECARHSCREVHICVGNCS